MEDFWDIIVWFLVASVKFVIAVTKLLVISSRDWYWDMLIVMAGGTFGVLVFTFLGKYIDTYKIIDFQIFTVVGVLLGLSMALYQGFKSIKQIK
jgi:hypothetical protein